MERASGRASGAGSAPAAVPPLVPADATAALPLSFAQERLWLLTRLDPEGTVYNMPMALCACAGRSTPRRAGRGPGARSSAATRSLRTTFGMEDGRPVQRIAPAAVLAVPVVDLSALPKEDRGVAAERLSQPRGPATASTSRAARCSAPAAAARRATSTACWLNVHHIAADGWSLGVLAASWWRSTAWRRTAARRPCPSCRCSTPTSPSGSGAGSPARSSRGCWTTARARLAGAPPSLDLPADRPRPAVLTHRGGDVRRLLPPELAGRLRSLAERSGATLFMVLLAALAAVLSRWSGERDCVIGAPLAERPHPRLEGLIGCFLNTLALRVRLAGTSSFAELLARVRQEALAAFAERDLPFERLLEELDPPRDLSRTPVFQVFLNVLNFPMQAAGLPGLALELGGGGEPEAKFDLTLYASESEAGIALRLVYAADLFDPPRMAELLSQLAGFLGQAAEAPERPWQELSLVTEEARAVLPDPAAPLAESWPGPVDELFERQAAERPDAVALRDPQGTWSYGRLARASHGLARRLTGAGVGREDRVGILAHRDASLAAAILAVLAAGAAFFVLDPTYPARRLASFVARARPRALLLLEAAGELPPEVVTAMGPAAPWVLQVPASLDAADWPGSEDARPPAEKVGPGSPAVIGFTSGSAGEPKGVLGAHGSLTAFLPFWRRRFGLGPGDRFTVLSGLAHDPLQRDLLFPLALGAAAVFPEPERIGEPGYLAAWVAAEAVTVANLTPAMAQLVTTPAPGRDLPLAPALTWAFLVGEALRRSDVHRLRRLAPRLAVVNLYGSTETQRSVGYRVVSAGDEAGHEVLPLGSGMGGCQLLVLTGDRDGELARLAGVGELGEIGVRSPFLALGYLDDAAATAARFRGNPFTDHQGDRIYLTGDLGRYLPDGGVAFAGRADRQVKLRGFRVELEEIEGWLERHPAVAEAAVALQPGPTSGVGEGAGEGADPRLVAYVVGRADVPEPEAPPRSSRAAAPRLHGAEFFRPSRRAAAHSERKARSPSSAPASQPGPGFLDCAGDRGRAAGGRNLGRGAGSRRRLDRPRGSVLRPRWPVALGDAGDRAVVAGARPGGSPARAVPRAAPGGLRRRGRGPPGGKRSGTRHVDKGRGRMSEEATATAVPAGGGKTLSPRELLEERLRARASRGAERASIPRRSAASFVSPSWAPLSFAQERLWFLDQFEPGNTAYHVARAYRVRGALDRPRLARALQLLVERHAVLRTVFAATPEGPRQLALAAEPGPPALPSVDLGSLSTAERTAAVMQLARREALSPFDLARQPPLRAVLLAEGKAEHVLLLTLHHVATDAWSMGLLYRELAALYAGGELPPLAIDYADYAAWQRERLTGERMEDLLAWWRAELDGAPPVLELPADRPRPRRASQHGAALRHRLPPGVVADLARAGAELSATPFMLFLSAFTALLWRYTGHHDLLLGTPVANRQRREVEGLVGLFVNTLVLRLAPRGGERFADLVTAVRGRAVAALAHQELPFERLVEELAPERDLGRTALFQHMFLGQEGPEGAPALSGLEVERLYLGREEAKFDLSLAVIEEGGETFLHAQYATDLFDATRIHRLLGHLAGLLRQAVEHPGRALAALQFLSPAERAQMLGEWNDTAWPPGLAARGLHELVWEASAAQTDAIAVVWADELLSYGELQSRALSLSAQLRDAGIGPEDIVGVHLERSPSLPVAALAILEAGGVYLPLDPVLPVTRLEGMIEDAQPALVITEQGTHPAAQSLTVILSEAKDLGGGSTREPSPQVLRFAQDDKGAKTAGTGPAATFGEIPPRGAAGARVTLLRGAQRARVSSTGAGEHPSPCPQREGPPPAPGPGPVPVPDQAAYVIFTSGSTGRPKGVVVSHAAIVNRILWGQQAYPVTADDGVMQSASIGFDFAVWELFAPLAAGARLILPGPEAARDPLALATGSPETRASIAHCVPSLMALFLDTGRRRPRLRLAPGLRRRRGAAARARPPVPRRHAGGALEPVRPHRGHGRRHLPAAAANLALRAAGHRADRPADRQHRTLVAGADLRALPAGVAGELLLGGAGLARGYLGRPDLTAERFVPDPSPAASPARALYRTGDLARWLARPGCSSSWAASTTRSRCAASASSRARSRRRSPRTRRCATRRSSRGADGAGEPRLRRLRGAARRPRASAGRAARPRSPRGCPSTWCRRPSSSSPRCRSPPTARSTARALPGARRPRRRPASATSRRAPRSRSCSPASGASCPGRARGSASHDDFFELGGHSLLATRVVSRLRDALRRRAAAAQPLRAADGRRAGARRPAARLERGAGAGRPLVALLRQAASGAARSPSPRSGSGSSTSSSRAAPAYNMPAARCARRPARAVAGALPVAGRDRCAATRRCAPAFAAARRAAGAARRRRPAPCRSPVVDLSALGAGRARAPSAALARPRGAAALRPRPRAAAALALVRLRERQRRALRCSSPSTTSSATAGRSAILVRELAALYAAPARRGRSGSPLPALPVQYADFAVWQRRLAARRAARARSSPAGASGSPARRPCSSCRPTGRGRRCAAPAAAAGSGRASPPALRGRLRRLSAGAHGATLFMALPPAFQALLARCVRAATTCWSARRSPAAPGAEIEGLIGFFVNTLVLRAATSSGDPTFARAAAAGCARGDARRLRAPGAAVRAAGRGAGAGAQPAPLAALPGDARPAERAARRRLALPGLAVRAAGRCRGRTAKFDLDAGRSPTTAQGASSRGCRVRRRPLRPHHGRSGCCGHLERLLRGGARRTPERRVCRAAAAARAAERRQLSAEWNDSARPRARAAHGRTSCSPAQAARGPDAVAVVSGEDGVWTYGGARPAGPTGWPAACAACGVGPEVPVGALRSSARAALVGACSPSSRPAAPTCRSIPPTRAERLALPAGRRRRAGAGDRGPRRPGAEPRLGVPCRTLAELVAESPPSACRCRRRSGRPRLRDVHLGLDRAAQGRGGRRTAASFAWCARRDFAPLGAGEVLAAARAGLLRRLDASRSGAPLAQRRPAGGRCRRACRRARRAGRAARSATGSPRSG